MRTHYTQHSHRCSNHHKDSDEFQLSLFRSVVLQSGLTFVGQVLYRQAEIWVWNTRGKVMGGGGSRGSPFWVPNGFPNQLQENGDPGTHFHGDPQNFMTPELILNLF